MAETYTHTHTHTHTHGCLCKVIISAIAGLAIISPSYSDIDKNAQSATCDSSTIGTTTGPANLEAAWTANTINLDFYSNDTKVGTGTCSYDGGIILPNTPDVPTGYTFGGWRLRAAAAPQQSRFDLSTWEYGSATMIGYSQLNGETGFNETKYGLTFNSGEWATEFTNGTVKGIARCSTTNGTYAQTGSPANDLGTKCWCQATGYAEHTDGNYVEYSPVESSSWVFCNDYGGSDCVINCANYCSYYVADYTDFRRAVFGVTQ